MMYRIAAILLITLFCSGCAGVSKTTSSTWGKTKSLFGLGGEKPERKITVDTYPSRRKRSTNPLRNFARNTAAAGCSGYSSSGDIDPDP